MRTYYDQNDLKSVIERLTDAIAAAFPPDKPLAIIGIRTRGDTLANRIVALLGKRGYPRIPQGTLDITLYRDDLTSMGPKPMVRSTEIDFDINGIPLLLVDDVLFTGRSVRSAMNALVDFGRPSAIRLAVLVDRNGRELPIAADFAGLTLRDVPADHRVNVRFVEDDNVDEIVVEPK